MMNKCQNNIQKPEDLGVLVRKYRKEQGLTQEDLALMANVGRRFIVELEKGKQSLHLGKVMEVMEVLGIGLSVVALWSQNDEE